MRLGAEVLSAELAEEVTVSHCGSLGRVAGREGDGGGLGAVGCVVVWLTRPTMADYIDKALEGRYVGKVRVLIVERHY